MARKRLILRCRVGVFACAFVLPSTFSANCWAFARSLGIGFRSFGSGSSSRPSIAQTSRSYMPHRLHCDQPCSGKGSASSLGNPAGIAFAVSPDFHQAATGRAAGVTWPRGDDGDEDRPETPRSAVHHRLAGPCCRCQTPQFHQPRARREAVRRWGGNHHPNF
jgi:hypothetical protein